MEQKNLPINKGIPHNERYRLANRDADEIHAETGELHAFYGSLRKGEYNASRTREGYEYIKTTTITGYKLFGLYSYPAAVYTGNNDDTMVVDIFRITDANTAKGIYGMELGASYHHKKVVIDNEEHSIYLFDDGWYNNKPVPSGDWSKRQELEVVS